MAIQGSKIADQSLNRIQQMLIELLRKVRQRDHHSWFSYPVDPVRDECPDYFDYVKKEDTMDFGTMEEKIRDKEIVNLDDFCEHVEKILACCRKYNTSLDNEVRQNCEEIASHYVLVVEAAREKFERVLKQNNGNGDKMKRKRPPSDESSQSSNEIQDMASSKMKNSEKYVQHNLIMDSVAPKLRVTKKTKTSSDEDYFAETSSNSIRRNNPLNSSGTHLSQADDTVVSSSNKSHTKDFSITFSPIQNQTAGYTGRYDCENKCHKDENRSNKEPFTQHADSSNLKSTSKRGTKRKSNGSSKDTEKSSELLRKQISDTEECEQHDVETSDINTYFRPLSHRRKSSSISPYPLSPLDQTLLTKLQNDSNLLIFLDGKVFRVSVNRITNDSGQKYINFSFNGQKSSKSLTAIDFIKRLNLAREKQGNLRIENYIAIRERKGNAFVRVQWSDKHYSWEPLENLRKHSPVGLADWAIRCSLLDNHHFTWVSDVEKGHSVMSYLEFKEGEEDILVKVKWYNNTFTWERLTHILDEDVEGFEEWIKSLDEECLYDNKELSSTEKLRNYEMAGNGDKFISVVPEIDDDAHLYENISSEFISGAVSGAV